jgi:hypothetical protein
LPRRLKPQIHIGNLVGDALKYANRLPELLARLRGLRLSAPADLR